MHLHILGICGTFMGGLAALAREAGHRVTGCDAEVYPPMSEQLRALGIELIEGYGAGQMALAPDVFVVGICAIKRGNPLMEAVLDAGVRYTSGPQWLADHVLQGRHVLAVAGTHGKTTTTAMLAWMLDQYAAAPPDWLWPVGDISTDTYQANYPSLEPYLQSGALQANQRLTRLYPEGGIAPHIIGYTGRISPEKLPDYQTLGYQGDEIIGLTGVEAWGEDYLNGDRGGVLSVIGPAGEIISTIAEREPRQARSVYTTFNATFDQAVQQALTDALTTHPLGFSGAVVVLEVNTGKVLAMASYPTYDPAGFDPRTPNPNLKTVLNDPAQPLLNRATQVNFPPGSIFKLVTFSAGILSGLYTTETRYTSPGTWNRLGDAYIKTDLAGRGTWHNLATRSISRFVLLLLLRCGVQH